MATGIDHCSLAFEYLVGKSTVQSIIPEVCDAIWNLRESYLNWPNDLETISDGFNNKNKFPHCCGAVDGKHIRIQKPAHSGSLYYNYKNYFSIVLLAVCDADANFLYIDVGAYGSQADGNVWSHSSLGTAITMNEMNWPQTKNLPNSDISFHYFFIGDEAFPVSKHMLRPYSGRNLDAQKQYFNTRLSSARNIIERSFGIFSNIFRIFRSEILTTPEHAESIVRACCVLYNYIRNTADGDTPDFSIPMSTEYIFDGITIARGRPTSESNRSRDIYNEYIYSNRE